MFIFPGNYNIKSPVNVHIYLGFSPYPTAFFLRGEKKTFSVHPTAGWNIDLPLRQYADVQSMNPFPPEDLSACITCELLQTLCQEQTFLGKNVDFLLQIWRCDPRFRDPDSFSSKLKKQKKTMSKYVPPTPQLQDPRQSLGYIGKRSLKAATTTLSLLPS